MVRRLLVGVLLTVCPVGHAADATRVSPALERYPSALLTELRGCAGQSWFSSNTSEPVEHVVAWFRAFRTLGGSPVLWESHKPNSGTQWKALNRARGVVDRVRRLVDYRTEQALIAMIDAAIGQRWWGSGCRAVASRLVLRIAAQRDRAWVWADTMDRILTMDEARWETELRRRRLQEALRRVERSYEELGPDNPSR